ncbi:PTS IIA-like nitrogen-regulatory protein PtsN [Arboricoccus pini]|uniref:PTS IIA-like nitrogen-regulatory protein PtsN n=1 Tax=Arboricoccus pini TaxID=1963835 RepID=A0A212QZQ0_9PROT|nr:PTS sugar transporter subunit IIA [Arboricoccus pini]SNB65213.1 PTS IIA-like nitrogen-regulatory protein PtsN [Arboricoccus pini]
MTRLEELVTCDRIVCGLEANNKSGLLHEVAHIAAERTGIAAARIEDALLERERLGTTGLGGGIAIPHARIPELPELTGFFVRLNRPIDFDAVDAEPVDLIFVLLAPEEARVDHLKALARIARILRDGQLCNTLRCSEDREAVHGLLTKKADPISSTQPRG